MVLSSTPWRCIALVVMTALWGPEFAFGNVWQRDPTFQPALENPSPASETIEGVFLLPDGGALVNTTSTLVSGQPVGRLVRLRADGTVDTTFHPPMDAVAASVTPDGKILAIKSPIFSNVPWILMRLSNDGTMDPAFQVQPMRVWARCSARAQANGQILVFGGLFSVGGVAAGGIARLNSDGAVDRTFAASLAYPTYIDEASQQTNGGVVVTGVLIANGGQTAIARLNADGSLDPQFTPETRNPGISFRSEMGVLANDQVLVATTSQIAVRLNSDGTLDPTYAVPTLSSVTHVGRPLANGRIYYTQESGDAAVVHRLNADGSVDANFSIALPGGQADSGAGPVTWDESSYYFDQALTSDRYAARQFVTKFDATGALVSRFAPRFSRAANVAPVGRSANGNYLLSGQIDYASGQRLTGTSPTTIRLQTDGSLDASLHPPSGAVPFAVERDGHFVEVTTDDAHNILTAARYASDGSLTAKYDLTAPQNPFAVRPVADNGGGVLYATDASGVYRFTATGTWDTSFDASRYSAATQIIPTIDDKVFITYEVTDSTTLPYGSLPYPGEAPGLHVVRLLSTGATDPAFAEITLPAGAGNLFCGLPDGGLLLIQDLTENAYLHYVGYDVNGQTSFAYDGPRNDALSIAGVLYDRLTAGTAGGEISVNLSPALPNLKNLPDWINVRSDGQVTFGGPVFYFDHGSLARYDRTSSDGPSVPLAPTMALDPAPAIPTNGSANFTAAAYGEEPFTYAWKFNGQPLNRAGTAADQAVLQLSNVQAADAGAYSVTISNRWGTVTSAPATLSMDAPSPITDQSLDQVVREGATMTLSVTATAKVWLRYQWQVKGPVAADWTNLTDDSVYANTTDSELTAAGVTAAMSGNQYRCIVSTDTSSGISRPITLTVSAAHDFSGTYSCDTILNGNPLWAMKVNADGTGTLIAYLPDRQSAFIGHLTVGATGDFSGEGTETPSPTIGAGAKVSFSGLIAPDGSVAGQILELNTLLVGKADTSTRANTRAGFYLASALGTNPGVVYTIVSASGQAIAVIASPAEADGAEGILDQEGQLVTTTWNDTRVAIEIDAAGQNLKVTLDGIRSATPMSYVAVEASAASKRLVNISTRAQAGTGDNVTICGFVVSGSAAKKYLIRAVGPTLTSQGIGSSEVLLDPTIELHDALHGNTVVARNDNWGDNINRSDIVSLGGEIGANPLSPTDTTSAAILPTLPPGVYSFIAQGKSGTAGIVLLEMYDAEPTNTGAALVNLSARARTTAGNGVTIGGFVVSGNAPKHLLVRAVGPTLATQGLNMLDVLQDPILEVHDAVHGNVIIATNDNWTDNGNAAAVIATAAKVGATPLAGTDTTSSALLLTAEPGIYSFVASGKNGATGIVLIEIYDAD